MTLTADDGKNSNIAKPPASSLVNRAPIAPAARVSAALIIDSPHHKKVRRTVGAKIGIYSFRDLSGRSCHAGRGKKRPILIISLVLIPKIKISFAA